MVVYRYEYVGTLKDSAYFLALTEREIGIRALGITIYPDKFTLHFPRELTTEEKSRLDSLVAENPVPTSEYEISPVTPDDVEREIGVRPIILTIDPATGTARVQFDTTLTLEQEALLEALLRAPMRFKRKP